MYTDTTLARPFPIVNTHKGVFMFVSKDDLGNACREQFNLFVKLFPDGVEVTRAVCVEHAQVFDWTWAAHNLLSLAQHTAYREAVASAGKAYREVMASAREAYDEAVASAPVASLACRAYREAMASACKAYDEAVASAFFEATLVVES